jgi:SAM-dependent methyltransferase
MIKKTVRFIYKFLFIFTVKIINLLLKKSNIKVLPALEIGQKFNFEFSKKTRRYILRKKSNSFGKIILDSSLDETSLCKLGRKFNTNKSSYNLGGHRSGYTSFYNLIFANLINKKCSVAEIGIEKNASTKMWREYFKKAKIDCFEIDRKKINLAYKDKLKNVKYHYIDVSNKKIISSQFKKTKKKYDIIIDDSTHLFDHQINIILSTYKFLKPGGILVIEDIYKFRKNYEENKYYEKIKYIKNFFSHIVFLETPHVNNFTASWKNEKILLLIKK